MSVYHCHRWLDIRVINRKVRVEASFFFFFSYFIAPHSYIPPGSGLGTRRLTLKYHFLKYIIHLVQCYLIVACILLRWLSMFFRTFSAVLSSLCFAPLMRAFHTFQIVPLYLLITIASGILLMFSIRSILFFCLFFFGESWSFSNGGKVLIIQSSFNKTL